MFDLSETIAMLRVLEAEMIPMIEHPDPGALNDCWKTVFESLEALNDQINSPINNDFFRGIENEAAHQFNRWNDHDSGKTDQDWMFLFGWLSSKACEAKRRGEYEKARHHGVSSAAALLNFYRRIPRDEGVPPG